MKNYRLFSLVAIVVLALAGGAASYIVSDAPIRAQAPAGELNNASTTQHPCAQKCGDGPCVPCTPEQCAERCGVDIETAKACMKTAACQTGASCAAQEECKMTSAKAGKCGSGAGCARKSL
jgi:hypothetical protein